MGEGEAVWGNLGVRSKVSWMNEEIPTPRFVTGYEGGCLKKMERNTIFPFRQRMAHYSWNAVGNARYLGITDAHESYCSNYPVAEEAFDRG